jgi:lipid-A-disaccharide synthase
MPSTRIHQYVCPQVWAWNSGRTPEIGKTFDSLYCLFDFEPELFKGYPVEALWVGNPLVETTVPEVDQKNFFRQTGMDPEIPLVALLPGSRPSEVQRILPPMVELVQRWNRDPERQNIQWVLPLAPTLKSSDLLGLLGKAPIHLVEGLGLAARAHANAALVCSGTATLETALLGTPFVVVYKLNSLTYRMAKRLVKLPHIGLVNLVAGRGVVPELIQDDVNPERLGQELEMLLEPRNAARMKTELAGIRRHLGEPGAADRVAEHLIAKMEG